MTAASPGPHLFSTLNSESDVFFRSRKDTFFSLTPRTDCSASHHRIFHQLRDAHSRIQKGRI